MAKKSRRNQVNPNKDVLDRHRSAVSGEVLRQRLDLHRSGASGAHASSGVLPSAAAGRKTKMGSRSARTQAAVRDYS